MRFIAGPDLLDRIDRAIEVSADQGAITIRQGDALVVVQERRVDDLIATLQRARGRR